MVNKKMVQYVAKKMHQDYGNAALIEAKKKMGSSDSYKYFVHGWIAEAAAEEIRHNQLKRYFDCLERTYLRRQQVGILVEA